MLERTFLFDMLVSNLGLLDFDNQYRHFKLEGVWGPAVLAGSGGQQTVGAATVNGSPSLLPSSADLQEGLSGAAERILDTHLE